MVVRLSIDLWDVVRFHYVQFRNLPKKLSSLSSLTSDVVINCKVVCNAGVTLLPGGV